MHRGKRNTVNLPHGMLWGGNPDGCDRVKKQDRCYRQDRRSRTCIYEVDWESIDDRIDAECRNKRAVG
jgi:hypothetical protein